MSEARGSGRLRVRRALGEVAYLAGLLVTAGVAYYVLILLPSRLQTDELRRRHERAFAEGKAIEAEISTLERDAAALEHDPWAVERALRSRLVFLRPGERVFVEAAPRTAARD
ncbi:MAG: septum formation initiator family protein [Planctomycetota bacterium]